MINNRAIFSILAPTDPQPLGATVPERYLHTTPAHNDLPQRF